MHNTNTFIVRHDRYPGKLYRAEFDHELGEWVVYEGQLIHGRFGQNEAAARFTAQACNEKRQCALARDVLVVMPLPSSNPVQN